MGSNGFLSWIKKIFVFLVVFIFIFFLLRKEISFENKATAKTDLLFVGDIMLSRGIQEIVYREQDPLYHFLRVKVFIESADISFGNLESPVSERGIDQGSQYSFRAHPDLLLGLSYAGFDIVSIANNHAFDWGKDAFLDTISNLDKRGILPVGGGENYTSAHTPVKIERNGDVFCFLAYSEFAWDDIYNESASPAMAQLDTKSIIDDIVSAKNGGCAAITISLHWGEEYSPQPSDSQKKIAQKLIDNGALLVIGHHPHVVQDVERYGNGLIAYSLGNFVFDQNFSQATKNGLALQVSVSDGKILDYEKIPIGFTKTFQPYVIGGPEGE